MYNLFGFAEPVTSVVPSADATTLLVTTLDSHVRLFDAATGKLLNAFTGHAHMSYRCRACFGHEEASVVCGDENGQVWAWDLVDVGSDVPGRISTDIILGGGFAAKPSSQGPQQGDHLDRAPSERGRGDDHCKR